ncbi:MAG: AbrB/MazE/SpoVT family DNA-binding domain-containing protein [Acidimicrobiia bacterium]|nr:AbrB/MazE/SpoVT family DNA-binding domain-containing protein [Acidimicrobiia bacterium]MCC5954368.1 AbrB/MazE/SpoVT family DNA-binding domain-containing protein [Acidimicrobiia bacterium]
MRATIDQAGRLVIPKALRDQLGLRPGEVELVPDGAALRLEPVTSDELAEVAGRLVIPSADQVVTADEVRMLRDVDQR